MSSFLLFYRTPTLNMRSRTVLGLVGHFFTSQWAERGSLWSFLGSPAPCGGSANTEARFKERARPRDSRAVRPSEGVRAVSGSGELERQFACEPSWGSVVPFSPGWCSLSSLEDPVVGQIPCQARAPETVPWTRTHHVVEVSRQREVRGGLRGKAPDSGGLRSAQEGSLEEQGECSTSASLEEPERPVVPLRAN